MQDSQICNRSNFVDNNLLDNCLQYVQAGLILRKEVFREEKHWNEAAVILKANLKTLPKLQAPIVKVSQTQ